MIRTTHHVRMRQLQSATSPSRRQAFIAAALGLVLTAVSAVEAQDFHSTTVSYDVRGEVKATDAFTNPTTFGGQDFKQTIAIGLGHPVELLEEWEAEVSNPRNGDAFAQANVFAQADFGVLRVGLSGVVQANQNAAPDHLFNSRRSVHSQLLESRVRARFQDTAVVNDPGRAPFSEFAIYNMLWLSGDLGLTTIQPVAPPGTDGTPSAGGHFYLRLTSPTSEFLTQPYPGNLWAQTLESPFGVPFTTLRNVAPSFLTLRTVVRNGLPFTFDYTLDLYGTAGVGMSTNSLVPLFGAAYFDADFTHSLLWGGITSINDALTGEPIENWTITSASGFDYRYAIPEPSSAAMLAGLAMLIVGRRSSERGQ